MMQSSIRFSLVGAQVGCTTKMSRARTFCSISTSTSPSEKRPTLALPSSMPRCVAMSCARAGLALPVNRTVLNSTATFVRPNGQRFGSALGRIWQGRKDSNLRMSESKSDALTNLATPLHRFGRLALAPPSNLRFPPGPARRADGAPGCGTSGSTSLLANRSASLPRAPGRCPPGRRPRCPNPSSGCCRTPPASPASRPRHLGTKRFGRGLKIVAPEAVVEFRLGFPQLHVPVRRTPFGLGKARDYSSLDGSATCGRAEDAGQSPGRRPA